MTSSNPPPPRLFLNKLLTLPFLHTLLRHLHLSFNDLTYTWNHQIYIDFQERKLISNQFDVPPFPITIDVENIEPFYRRQKTFSPILTWIDFFSPWTYFLYFLTHQTMQPKKLYITKRGTGISWGGEQGIKLNKRVINKGMINNPFLFIISCRVSRSQKYSR